MSAIADFRIIETSKLKALCDNAEIKIEKKLFGQKTIDNYWNFLNANSKKLKDFEYSGYIFANLLEFLAEKKGIDLLNSEYNDIANSIAEERQNSTIILTFDHHREYVEKLDPNQFSLQELIAFNKDFSEDDDPKLAEIELEGIRILQDSLRQLSDHGQVVLLSVG